jgi:hypothetical protein
MSILSAAAVLLSRVLLRLEDLTLMQGHLFPFLSSVGGEDIPCFNLVHDSNRCVGSAAFFKVRATSSVVSRFRLLTSWNLSSCFLSCPFCGLDLCRSFN